CSRWGRASTPSRRRGSPPGPPSPRAVARAPLSPRSSDLLDEDEDEEEGDGQGGREHADPPVDLAHEERVAVGEGGEDVGRVAGGPAGEEPHVGEVAHG